MCQASTPSHQLSVGGWANSQGQGMSHLQTSNQSPTRCHVGVSLAAPGSMSPSPFFGYMPIMMSPSGARRMSRLYYFSKHLRLKRVVGPALLRIADNVYSPAAEKWSSRKLSLRLTEEYFLGVDRHVVAHVPRALP